MAILSDADDLLSTTSTRTDAKTKTSIRLYWNFEHSLTDNSTLSRVKNISTQVSTMARVQAWRRQQQKKAGAQRNARSTKTRDLTRSFVEAKKRKPPKQNEEMKFFCSAPKQFFSFGANRKKFFWMNLFFLNVDDFKQDFLPRCDSDGTFWKVRSSRNLSSALLLLLLLAGIWRRRRGRGWATVSVGRHLLVGNLEELERGLLQLVDGFLDLFGVHAVLVGQLVADLADQVANLGHLFSWKLVLQT